MRGKVKAQPELFQIISPESLVPPQHPIRGIRTLVDKLLKDMSPRFNQMYAEAGRPSIPPERILKSRVLMALYSIRSERLLAEQLRYNFLYRWFLDMNLDEEPFDHSIFSKNQQRLEEHGVNELFFGLVVEEARLQGWVSDDHFTVDGTLIDAWASLKSFQPKKGKKDDSDDDSGNPNVDFHGQKRSNATHQSKSEGEARLLRKGKGKEAKLCFAGHALMENRHGLCLDFRITPSVGVTETKAATEMLEDWKRINRGNSPASVGADKGYHNKEFVGYCRDNAIKPHVAPMTGRKTPGLDGRTIGSKGYQTSQRIRKRVEEIFGWMKSVGGLRQTKYRGVGRNQLWGYMVGASYNLLRMSKLGHSPPAVIAGTCN